MSAMLSPLTAPSTAPISMARAVPNPWEAHPMASPLATGWSSLNSFHRDGPMTAPMNPQSTTDTAVREMSPPNDFVKSIAIGVVTDFDSKDNTNISLRFNSLQRI